MLDEGQHEAQVDARTDGRRKDLAHRRLQDLYEISKIFASCEDIEQPFDPALAIVSRTLPLRSAILIETDAGRSEMVLWKCEGQSAGQTAAAKRHAQEAYQYLIGMPAAAALKLTEQEGTTLLPRPVDSDGEQDDRFIVIPLVVAQRSPFGALQFEGVKPLDKSDLVFVNAIANQLAIALDRERAWQRDIARRDHAEERRTHAEEGRTAAEAKGATAVRDRIEAESASDRYEALAAENARLYREARQAVRAREQILAIVSHDLKNPLGAILMTADALAKRGIPDERRHGLPQAAARIHRAAERMLRLIEDLLDFASIEAGRLAIKRGPQDPGRMIQEILASFEGVAQAKGLLLTADIEPHLPQVYCDRDRILQVFSNLVGNATKATAEGGQITLRVETRDHEVIFTVSDNGPGISAEDLAHLFERYWRSGEAEYQGTGLGLAIARGIVSAHGGRIWAESQPGSGATLMFTIPTADVTSLFTTPVPDATALAHGLIDARTTEGI